MDTHAEREMTVLLTGDIETVGITEGFWIAVARTEKQVDNLAALDSRATNLYIFSECISLLKIDGSLRFGRPSGSQPAWLKQCIYSEPFFVGVAEANTSPYHTTTPRC